VTPMMCARLLRPAPAGGHGRLYLAGERAFAAIRSAYERSLAWALRHSLLTIAILAATIGLNVYLYIEIPKGFFPQQDTGRLIGWIRGDQSSSFQAMQQKMTRLVEIVRSDPAVETLTAVTGGGSRNSGTMFVSLKPLKERGVSAGAGGGEQWTVSAIASWPPTTCRIPTCSARVTTIRPSASRPIAGRTSPTCRSRRSGRRSTARASR